MNTHHPHTHTQTCFEPTHSQTQTIHTHTCAGKQANKHTLSAHTHKSRTQTLPATTGGWFVKQVTLAEQRQTAATAPETAKQDILSKAAHIGLALSFVKQSNKK